MEESPNFTQYFNHGLVANKHLFLDNNGVASSDCPGQCPCSVSGSPYLDMWFAINITDHPDVVLFRIYYRKGTVFSRYLSWLFYYNLVNDILWAMWQFSGFVCTNSGRDMKYSTSLLHIPSRTSAPRARELSHHPQNIRGFGPVLSPNVLAWCQMQFKVPYII